MSQLSDIYDEIWDGQLGCYDAETITIDGTEYECESGELTLAENLVPGGEWAANSVQVACRRSQFTTIPALQSRATFGGIIYRIDRIREQPDTGIIIFELLPAHE